MYVHPYPQFRQSAKSIESEFLPRFIKLEQDFWFQHSPSFHIVVHLDRICTLFSITFGGLFREPLRLVGFFIGARNNQGITKYSITYGAFYL